MINIDYLVRDLSLVRERSPLVHNITNYVAMNNSANALLAVGASPVMAHSLDEVAEMAGIASSLVINIGTLEAEWVKAMLIAGKTALDKHIPVVFDPVGAGATSYRSEVCTQIIEECKPSVIRGNASEIIALFNAGAKTKGVDSTNTSEAALHPAKALAGESGSIVVISGETDYITDGSTVEIVRNGNPMMAKVTGMGCTASAIVGAFIAVNPNFLEAATHAMFIMGIAGEIAARSSKGNGSLQINFLDTLFNIDEESIRKNIRL
ncbi:hydroxyethylthiazole kinase [uncultured Proteiniphilum sp.]|uniref:hydroxyethylthiazole kinase n=1 Tax=uncultured Proteiniphilum sp. TaxID=497637 RepID=UPI00261B526F|nr:hydroxyethylthiazole kinase [uncultured Proteiniphilum sp.]